MTHRSPSFPNIIKWPFVPLFDNDNREMKLGRKKQTKVCGWIQIENVVVHDPSLNSHIAGALPNTIYAKDTFMLVTK